MRKHYVMRIAMLCALVFVLTGSHTQAVNYDREIKEEEEKQKSFEKRRPNFKRKYRR